MTTERKIWFNGNILPESKAKLSVYDSALMFGDMVFEMTRSFNGVQFKLKEHLERLFRSMKYIHLDCGYTLKELEDACYRTIEANKTVFETTDEHRLLIDVSRGTLSLYEDVDGCSAGTNVIITDFPLRWTVSGMGKLYDDGINAVIPSQRAIPAHLIDPKIKHRSRLHLQRANIEVSKYKGKNNWALLLDTDNFVTEGTGSNFFIVKDGVLLTPEPRNILCGISRQYVFELAKLLGMPCKETNFGLYEVYNADEAFMTATPFCVLPVCRINSVDIGSGRMGENTKKLIDTWGELVGVDIIRQIKGWEGKTKNNSPYKF